MNPLLLVDSYKIHHTKMYPEGMSLLYSNFTPRKSRLEGVESVVVFGLQHFIKDYLIEKFNTEFFIFTKEDREGASDEELQGIEYIKISIIEDYKRHCPVDTKHIEALWDLGYLPIEIKALPEGLLCPIGVPLLTIKNTHPDFGWLVNYLETLISDMLWQPITSATIANEYRKLLEYYAKETTGSIEGVQWQAHDFSMRGMSSPESAILSGMAHLTSFTGTDTIPAIYQLEESYNATGLIGASVPATEHSVMCMGQKESEINTFKRLLDLYPEGILSVVSDTWDLWKVLTEYLPQLKEEILARDGKLVIRPDSGDPVDIICGKQRYGYDYVTIPPNVETAKDLQKYLSKSKVSLNEFYFKGKMYSIYMVGGQDGVYYYKEIDGSESKGVIELLWDVFGGTVNEQGYKVLDSHIGAIYGDSITLDRAKQICERLKAKGFASTNIVFGVGSYTYQYNTRDTFGFAMKATYGEVLELVDAEGTATNAHYESVGREIFKDPITDDGTKKSKKGLLCVDYTSDVKGHDRHIICYDQQSWEDEESGLLTTVFKDSKLTREVTLEEIRNRIRSN